MDDPITLFTTEDIISEMRRRYPDGSIIAYEMPEDQAKDAGYSWGCNIRGHNNVVAKLAFAISSNVNEMIQEGTEDVEPEKVDDEI